MKLFRNFHPSCHQQAYTPIRRFWFNILPPFLDNSPRSIWMEATSEQGDFPNLSRLLSTNSSTGNWGVIIGDFSDWPEPDLAGFGLGVFRFPSQLGSHHCSATQNSNCGDHIEKRMTLNRVLILGTLALTTMMSPSGSEDIVGEFTAEGCGDYIWEKELEGEKK